MGIPRDQQGNEKQGLGTTRRTADAIPWRTDGGLIDDAEKVDSKDRIEGKKKGIGTLTSAALPEAFYLWLSQWSRGGRSYWP